MRPRKRCADLVRAREAAKQISYGARHRFEASFIAYGQRATAGVKAWTELYMAWVRQLRYEQGGRRRRVWITSTGWSTWERGEALEEAITEAVKLASPQVQEVVRACRRYAGLRRSRR